MTLRGFAAEKVEEKLDKWLTCFDSGERVVFKGFLSVRVGELGVFLESLCVVLETLEVHHVDDFFTGLCFTFELRFRLEHTHRLV